MQCELDVPAFQYADLSSLLSYVFMMHLPSNMHVCVQHCLGVHLFVCKHLGLSLQPCIYNLHVFASLRDAVYV